MITKRRKSIFLTVILSIIILAGCSTSTAQTQMPSEMPDDFNFSVNYGVQGKRKVDTFTNSIIKDLVEDGTIEASLTLSNEEMKDIYRKMVEMNIMGELNLDKIKICHSEPEIWTEWTIQANGETKSIQYTVFCNETDTSRKFLALQDYIHLIVIKKEEYKKLPESRGYYE